MRVSTQTAQVVIPYTKSSGRYVKVKQQARSHLWMGPPLPFRPFWSFFMTGDDGTEGGLGGLMVPAIVHRLPRRRASPVDSLDSRPLVHATGPCGQYLGTNTYVR